MNLRSISNLKRRIWVWLAVVIVIVAVGSGYLVYGYGGRFLKRTDAAADFLVTAGITVGLIALFLGLNGFSYLHQARRVNLYHSLPVTAGDRFKGLYGGGVLAFVCGMALSGFITVFVLMPSTFSGPELTYRMLMAGVLTLLFFLTVYNITIYACTLTGNIFICLLINAVLVFYVDLWERVIDFSIDFAARSSFFATGRPEISFLNIYFGEIYQVVKSDIPLALNFEVFLPAFIRLSLWALFTYWLCSSNYRKRPAEASESLVAFYSSHMLIKLMIVVPISLLMGHATFESFSRGRHIAQIVAMILAAFVVSFIVELLFTSSARVAITKWGSIVVALFFIFVVFGIFRMYEKRFNAYVPESDELKSYAIFDPLDSYYYNFNLEFTGDGEVKEYADASRFVRDNMELTDNEAILELAATSVETDYHSMSSPLPLQVYYRLNSGRNVGRLIWVDMDDPANRKLLNRLIGPAYYKAGVWQAFGGDIPEGAKVTSVEYYDIVADTTFHIGDDNASASDIITDWRKAMTTYDFDHVRYKEVSGQIEIFFGDGMKYMWVLPVYDDMKEYLDLTDILTD